MSRISLSVRVGLLAIAWWCVPGPGTRSDTIFLKNGMVLRSQGAPDRDGTLLYLWDGLKRTVIYNSKVDRIVGDNTYRVGEKFTLSQPLTVHAGVMPKEVISVEAGPWNELGRRSFRYVGRSNRAISMEQALIEIGPHVAKYRGINGFWLAQVATSQIPREIVAGLLNRVDQKNQEERERVVRFFMNAGWYLEARKGLDQLIKDFPKTDLAERAAGAKLYMIQAEANSRRAEVEVLRKARQYKKAAALLKTFTEKEIGTETLIEVRDQLRREEDQEARDAALAAGLRTLEGKLPSEIRGTWKPRVAEVMKAIERAPDAVRDRFAAWTKAKAEPGTAEDKRFTLAMSGYVAGNESATDDLNLADLLWQARDLVRAYLGGAQESERENLIAKLDALNWPGDGDGAPGSRKLELVTRIIQLMPPPLGDEAPIVEKPIVHKLEEDDQNEVPTEYVVVLPPEYHPLRSYPALLVLHSGSGPQSAIEDWASEAARRGYILVAPEYRVPGQTPDYHYTPSEHAAAELALRDARKRYAIDSDRVFVAGQLSGGNMAWDLALGHPDLFAGAVVISGFPARYVPRSLGHHERMPLYFVIGDLAPAANEVIYASYIKPLIHKVYDVTYVEYHRRGLEEFPEEIPTLFEWMDHHHRDPFPKSFEVSSARTCDNRFHGVVIREFGPGRTTAPEAVEVLGRNLSPARLTMKSSVLGNLINLKTVGIDRRKLDVWLSPKLIDFKRKFEVRINDRARYKGGVKLTLDSMLEDLRLRGDRQQLYWVKVPAI